MPEVTANAVTTAAALAVALAAVELAKGLIHGRRNGANSNNGKRMAKMAEQIDRLDEVHRPVDGRLQWWFPLEEWKQANRDQIEELRAIRRAISKLADRPQ